MSSADIASDGERESPQLISVKKDHVHSSYHSCQLILICGLGGLLNGLEVLVVVAVCGLRNSFLQCCVWLDPIIPPLFLNNLYIEVSVHLLLLVKVSTMPPESGVSVYYLFLCVQEN